ncbi:MAG: hypothetical protein P9M03_07490, partial [Candidatus Theseobacter exili]|nr:hypothetical protein [Candidatus Theseobacter exili]
MSVFKKESSGSKLVPALTVMALKGMRKGRVFRGKGKREIVLFRDLHCQEEAQLLIANALSQIKDKTNVSSVLVEGAEGPLRTYLFRAFPNENARRTAGRKFLKEGYLSGAEYASIKMGLERNLLLYGVEDTELYLKNLRAFRNTRNIFDKVLSNIQRLDKWVVQIKDTMYSENMKSMDKVKDMLAGQELNLQEAFYETNKVINRLLKEEKDVGKYKNRDSLNEYKEILEIGELLDKESVDNEFKSIIQVLDNNLVAEDLKTMVSVTLEYRLGQIPASKYLETLKDLYESSQIGQSSFASTYPMVNKWFLLALRQDALDVDKVWKELTELSANLIDEFALKEGLEKIVWLDEQWRLYKKLIKLEMTRNDLDKLNEQKQPSKDTFSVEAIFGIHLDGRTLPEKPVISPFFTEIKSEAKDFYKFAQKRDKVLFTRTMAYLDKQKGENQSGILITGGFHTQGIQKLLEEKSISYVTWTPKVTGEIDNSRYEQIMMNESYDLDNLEFSEKRFAWRTQGSQIARMLSVPLTTGDILYRLSPLGREVFSNLIEALLESGISESGNSVNVILNEWMEANEDRNVLKDVQWDDFILMVQTVSRFQGIFINLPRLKPEQGTQKDLAIASVEKAFGKESGLARLTRRYFMFSSDSALEIQRYTEKEQWQLDKKLMRRQVFGNLNKAWIQLFAGRMILVSNSSLLSFLKWNYRWLAFLNVFKWQSIKNLFKSWFSARSDSDVQTEGIPVPLDQLIGFLREKSGQAKPKHFEEWFANPGKLASEAISFRGERARIGPLIHRQSGYKKQAALELAANGIDALLSEIGKAPIGRFGVGAFQVLAELEEDGDKVSWTTSQDGKKGWRVNVQIQEGVYSVSFEEISQGVSKGTTVEVYKINGYRDDNQARLNEYVTEKLRYNSNARVFVNGVLANPIEELTFQNGGKLNYATGAMINIGINSNGYVITDSGTGMDPGTIFTKLLMPRTGGKEIPPSHDRLEAEIAAETRVFYKWNEKPANQRVKSRLSILVNGIQIETFKLEGYNLPEEFVLELPSWTPLPESRDRIFLDTQTQDAVRIAMDKILRAPDMVHIPLINGMASLLGQFKNETGRQDEAAELIADFSARVKLWREQRTSKEFFLPNQKDAFEISVPEKQGCVYMDSIAMPFDPEQIPGSVQVTGPRWKSPEGYKLWAVPFKAGSGEHSFRHGKNLFINSADYERHYDVPAPLNIELNPAEVDYGAEEIPYGNITLPGRAVSHGPGIPSGIVEVTEETEADIILDEKIFEMMREVEVIDLPAGALNDIQGFLKVYLERGQTEDIRNWLKRFKEFRKIEGWAFSSELFIPARSKMQSVSIGSSIVGKLQNYAPVIIDGNLYVWVQNFIDNGLYLQQVVNGQIDPVLKGRMDAHPFQKQILVDGKWYIRMQNHEGMFLQEIREGKVVPIPQGKQGVENITSIYEIEGQWFANVKKDLRIYICKITDGEIEPIEEDQEGFRSLGKAFKIYNKGHVIVTDPDKKQYLRQFEDGQLGPAAEGQTGYKSITRPFDCFDEKYVIVKKQGLNYLRRIVDGRIPELNEGQEGFRVIQTPFNYEGRHFVIVTRNDNRSFVQEIVDGEITPIKEGDDGYKLSFNNPFLLDEKWYCIVENAMGRKRLLPYENGKIWNVPGTREYAERGQPIRMYNQWFVMVKQDGKKYFQPIFNRVIEPVLPTRPGFDHISDRRLVGTQWYCWVSLNGKFYLKTIDESGRIEPIMPGESGVDNKSTMFEVGGLWYVWTMHMGLWQLNKIEDWGMITILHDNKAYSSIDMTSLSPMDVEGQRIWPLVNIQDKTMSFFILPETPMRAGKWADLSIENVQGQMDQNLEVLFSIYPRSRGRYMENLFYLPEVFEQVDLQDKRVHWLIALIPPSVLDLMTEDGISTLVESMQSMGAREARQFLSFFEEFDVSGLSEEEVKQVIERWDWIWSLTGKNEGFTGSIFEAIRSNPGCLLPGFNVNTIQEESSKFMIKILRGEIEGGLEKRTSVKDDLKKATDEIRGIPLARMIMAYRKDPAAIRRVENLSDLRERLKAVRKRKTEAVESEITSAREGQDRTDQLFLRENVQNGVDALNEKGIEGAIEVNSYIEEESGNFVVAVEDGAGMDYGVFLGPFHVLDVTTKEGKGLSGIMGQGVYTNFVDFDQLRVKTSAGDGRVLSAVYEKDKHGKIILKSLQETREEWQGTRIERVKKIRDERDALLEHSMVAYNLARYVGALRSRTVLLNGKEVNEELTDLAAVETPLGEIRLRLSDKKIQRITQNGLYVERPNDEYLALVPKKFRKMLLERGLNIDLPAGVPLTRTRTTIANKEEHLEMIQKAVAVGVLKAMAQLFIHEGIVPPGISEDYLDSPVIEGWQLEKFEDYEREDIGTFTQVVPGDIVEIDALKINGYMPGETISDVDFLKYSVQEEDSEEIQAIKHRSLAYLITLIELDFGDEKLSMRDIRRRFLAKIRDDLHGAEKPEEEMDELFGPYLSEAKKVVQAKFVSSQIAERKDYDEAEIKENAVLNAFKFLSETVATAMGYPNIKIGFYYQNSTRLADFGPSELNWNIKNITYDINMFLSILRGEAKPEEINEFFSELLKNIAHELSHFEDGGLASHQRDEELVGLIAWRMKKKYRRFLDTGLTWDKLQAAFFRKISLDFEPRGSPDAELVDHMETTVLSAEHENRSEDLTSFDSDGLAVTGVKRIKESVEQRALSLAFRLDGRKITFNVDKELLAGLGISSRDFLDLMSRAIELDRELNGTSFDMLPDNITIALLEKSPHMFENHTADGFIGINRVLLNSFKDVEDRDLMLQAGLVHELRHEALVPERIIVSQQYESLKEAGIVSDREMFNRLLSDRFSLMSAVDFLKQDEAFSRSVERVQWGRDKSFIGWRMVGYSRASIARFGESLGAVFSFFESPLPGYVSASNIQRNELHYEAVVQDARDYIDENKEAFINHGLRITSCLGHAIEVQRRLKKKGIGSRL